MRQRGLLRLAHVLQQRARGARSPAAGRRRRSRAGRACRADRSAGARRSRARNARAGARAARRSVHLAELARLILGHQQLGGLAGARARPRARRRRRLPARVKRPAARSSHARPKRRLPSPAGAITAASRVSRRCSSSASSVTVPGVTTRTTWRSTGPFDLRRVADLLADRHRLALAHQPREVGVDAVVRHARHRDRLAGGLAARGQRDVDELAARRASS